MKATTILSHRNARFGAALSSVALAGAPASAAIVNLTFAFDTFVYFGTGGLQFQRLYDGTGSVAFFVAFNNGSAKSFGGNFGENGWVPGAVPFGSPISVGNATAYAVILNNTASGTQTFGFVTLTNQPGWMRLSLGGVGGDILYLAAAYNDVPGSTINAGQTAIAVVPESSTVLALAGLSMLAAGVGVRSVRRRRAAKKPAVC